jgi:Domain of unknown function (DUF5666)
MKRFYPFSLLAAVLACGIPCVAQSEDSSAQNSQAEASATATVAAPLPAPVTQRYDSAEATPSTSEPILPAPPMPKGTTTLVGAMVDNVDHVRNRVTIRPFGGNKMVVHFDERTHVYRDGVETTQLGIHKGDRVYVDTMLDGREILARNIRVVSQASAADARGQVLRNSGGELSLRDDLTGQAVALTVDTNTRIIHGGRPVSIADVRQGSLVSVQFSPDKANRGVAREISVLAAPGAIYTFAGRVTNLDLSEGQISIANQTDSRTYDISIARPLLPANLMVGSDVVVKAMFDGKEYKANSVNVTRAPTEK